MAKVNYERLKEKINEKKPDMDVDEEVKKYLSKLKNLSKEGAILIIANKLGMNIRPDKPKPILKTINSLKEGEDYVEIAGAVISVSDIRFYEVCPDCGKRTREFSGAFKCPDHGVIPSPAYSYLLNLVLDDGSGDIRVTLFSKQLEYFLKAKSGQILKFRENPEGFEDLKMKMLGKLLGFRGTVRKNNVTNQKEFSARLVFKNPEEVTPRVEAISTMIDKLEKIPDSDSDEDIEEIVF